MKHSVTFVIIICLVFLGLTPVGAKTKREEAQDLMQEMATSRDAEVRAQAAWQLGQMGATDAVPALTAALEDVNRSVRANAAASLWNLGDVAKPAMPALKKALNDPYAGVVSNAAGALVRLGVPRSELVPAYKRLLLEKKCRFRIAGLKGLLGQVPPADLFQDALQCSRDEDLDNRFAAGDVLRELMDKDNRAMIPLILAALKDSGDKNITDLVLAIVQYKPPVPEAVPILEQYLGAPDPDTRRIAAEGLGRLKETSLDALPSLIRLLEADPDADVRKAAATAIGEMGGKAKEAVPVLIRSVKDDKWPKVRQAAIQALGAMGEASRAAIPVLNEALKDSDNFIRNAARNALFRVDSENRAKTADASGPPPDGKAAAKAGSSLFEDAGALRETLVARVPEAVELVIYEDFAIATAPEPTSRTGYGRFTYRSGTVTGPDDGQANCKETFRIGSADFSILPRLVKEAPDLAEMPDGTISHVILGRSVFCKEVGWHIYVREGSKYSFVEFNLAGKMQKVTH